MDDEDEEIEEIPELEPNIDESETDAPVDLEKAPLAGPSESRSREPSTKSDTVKTEEAEGINGEKQDSRATSVAVKTED